MLKCVTFPALVGCMLVGSPAARAESASELLEKGIYTEQTVGDLDAAMKIYKKIIADEKENRPFAARAQLRLGECQLKKGDKAEATKTFEDLLKRFPDQKETVAKARKHVDDRGELKLKPVPWADGEIFEMVFKLGGGMEIGTIIYSAETKKIDGKRVWLLRGRRFMLGGTNQGISRVEADQVTFRPIRSQFYLSVMGHFDADYTPDKVTIASKTRGTSRVRKVKLNKVVYDNEQGMHLFRRLPFDVGYKSSVPIFATFGGGELDLGLEVTKKEKVEVPVGEFECFRVELDIGQIFWFSTDERRYPVKIEAGGIIMELAKIQPSEPNQYHDAKLGFSLVAKPDWYFYRNPEQQKANKAVVSILDPDAIAVTTLTVRKLDDLKPDEKASARAFADTRLPEFKKGLKEFTVRANSWVPCEIANRPAVRFVADYTDTGKKMVGYGTCVLGESTGATFFVKVSAEEFEAFGKKIDPIIDGFKVK